MVCCKERALLHEANERSALQQSSHASVTRECHKHCQVPNVTKIFKMTIEMKRCINPCSKRCKQHYLQQKRLDNIARPKLVRVPCWRRFFSRQLSIFTGSCFACGISLPLCFIIAQVPKQKKTHGTQFFQIDAAGFFSHCAPCTVFGTRVSCANILAGKR